MPKLNDNGSVAGAYTFSDSRAVLWKFERSAAQFFLFQIDRVLGEKKTAPIFELGFDISFSDISP